MNQRAKKRFGQHFLSDTEILDRIVSAFNPQQGENIVEIGPGRGALTELLLPHLDQLTAVELDRDLVSYLSGRFSKEKLNLVSSDILDVDLVSLFGSDPRPLRLIGNLPYNISTPLIFRLILQRENIQDMVFMLQKEVADRILATPNNHHWGRLSVMVQTYFQGFKLFDVPPSAFTPPPKVFSSVIKLENRHEIPVIKNVSHFKSLVAQAFNQRRKTIRNSLKSIITEQEIQNCNIDPGQRPETLSTEDFVRLSNYVS